MIENLSLFGIPLADATPFLSFPLLGTAILQLYLNLSRTFTHRPTQANGCLRTPTKN